jgi:hypothetical protein
VSAIANRFLDHIVAVRPCLRGGSAHDRDQIEQAPAFALGLVHASSGHGHALGDRMGAIARLGGGARERRGHVAHHRGRPCQRGNELAQHRIEAAKM